MAGATLKYPTPELLQSKIDEYFKYAKENNKPYTKTGMAVYLGVVTLTLKHYKELNDEYKEIIEDAFIRCEDWIVENMLTNKANATAAIFNLKNNYGWKDQSQLDVTTDGERIFNPSQLKEAAKEFLISDAEELKNTNQEPESE